MTAFSEGLKALLNGTYLHEANSIVQELKQSFPEMAALLTPGARPVAGPGGVSVSVGPQTARASANATATGGNGYNPGLAMRPLLPASMGPAGLASGIGFGYLGGFHPAGAPVGWTDPGPNVPLPYRLFYNPQYAVSPNVVAPTDGTAPGYDTGQNHQLPLGGSPFPLYNGGVDMGPQTGSLGPYGTLDANAAVGRIYAANPYGSTNPDYTQSNGSAPLNNFNFNGANQPSALPPAQLNVTGELVGPSPFANQTLPNSSSGYNPNTNNTVAPNPVTQIFNAAYGTGGN